jgi:CheY-like chemotaxis protein
MSAAVASALPGNGKSFHRADGQKRRVLYAEDQATARIVTTALLERMGFDVEAVEDGELAFEKAKEFAYDVILLDIEMPVMDGVTAARNIRANAAPCRETPILALSAFLADSTEHSVWRDAFDSALPKPANSNELQMAMHRLLSEKPAYTTTPKASSDAVPHWALLANSLPAGTLSILVKAAAREVNHLILAYGSCREGGDMETANHCRKALKSVAASFEIMGLLNLLKRHEQENTWPHSSELLQEAQQWQLH